MQIEIGGSRASPATAPARTCRPILPARTHQPVGAATRTLESLLWQSSGDCERFSAGSMAGKQGGLRRWGGKWVLLGAHAFLVVARAQLASSTSRLAPSERSSPKGALTPPAWAYASRGPLPAIPIVKCLYQAPLTVDGSQGSCLATAGGGCDGSANFVMHSEALSIPPGSFSCRSR